ncbi:hypothetical protein ACKGJN_14795 [Gillisia sp. Q332]|uniref:hypothetical protein n=1 Tax=Gillisia xinjiangensis TaxID=3384765 RepID=UPI00391B7030
MGQVTGWKMDFPETAQKDSADLTKAVKAQPLVWLRFFDFCKEKSYEFDIINGNAIPSCEHTF